jgi:blue light- and temperature-responsive anti-repressor
MIIDRRLSATEARRTQRRALGTDVIAFSYAFQPIVDTTTQKVFSCEALVRGPADEPAYWVLERVPAHLKHQFDQESRTKALALAARIGLHCHLNLNFLPKSLELSVDSIASTLEAAAQHGVAIGRIILEVTEGEVIEDHVHFSAMLNEYRGMGIKIAIDDFGAGYSGLNLLAEFQPDQVKIDMSLARGIEKHGPRQAIVRGITQVCRDLGIDVIAEGVETVDEYHWLEDQGIYLFQGYLFARPGFESLPAVRYPQTVKLR